MYDFELTKKIKQKKESNIDEIKSIIKSHLSNSCKIARIQDDNNVISIDGRVKEKIFTPVVFNASFTIKVEEDKTRISARGSCSTFWAFWVLFALGLFSYGITLAIAFILFAIQKSQPKELCERILAAIESELDSD